MDSPQVDPQPEVPIIEAQPLHTSPLRKLSRVHNVPLRYGFVNKNDNIPHIIENDDLTIYSKEVMSSNYDKRFEVMKFELDSMYDN